MQGQFFRISEAAQIENVSKKIESLIEAGVVAAVKIEEYSAPRSTRSNALMWMWFDELAKSFSRRGKDQYDKDQMHDLMCHKFLGMEPEKVVGMTTIPPRLKGTSKMSRAEMHHFMEQIEAWAADHGVLLTKPEDSEYMIWSKLNS